MPANFCLNWPILIWEFLFKCFIQVGRVKNLFFASCIYLGDYKDEWDLNVCFSTKKMCICLLTCFLGKFQTIYMILTVSRCFLQANFIDLDLKPLNKMAYYCELDQKIVDYYIKTSMKKGRTCDSTTGCAKDKQMQCQY